MQAQIQLLEAEPDRHSIVIVAIVGITRYLEEVGTFLGARCRLAYSGPDSLQLILDLLRTTCDVSTNVYRRTLCHFGFSSFLGSDL